MESKKTIHCLSQPIWHHFYAFFHALFNSPKSFLQTLRLAVSMGLRSHRGVLRHLAYLVEACTFLGILQKNEIQHVHAHFGTNSATVARFIKRLGGPGFSFTVHGPTEFDSAIGFDLKGKIEDSNFVIAITDYCSAQLRRWCDPEEWSKIHIVHCTVGDDFFGPVQSIDPNCRNFVSIGRLTAQKGQISLIDAFAKMIDKGYDANLIFVGDGELRERIEQNIAAYEIQDRVTITGYVPESEVRKLLAGSRALVLPSFAEGLPMVIMEAFAVGRPVISTYVAGIPELVIPGENGWLVPAGNADELSFALIEALEMPAEQLLNLANRGRDRTYQHHRTVIEGERFEKILLCNLDTSIAQ
jgi:glycosyltransferase involved in cell wall biosynthesis